MINKLCQTALIQSYPNFNGVKINNISFSSGKNIDSATLASKIDHTYLPPVTDNLDDIEVNRNKVFDLCREAKQYNFAAVCVRPDSIYDAVNQLLGTKINVATVIGFPKRKMKVEGAEEIVGNVPLEDKIAEAKYSVKYGADELDDVINVSNIKKRNKKALEKEVKELLTVADGKPVKFIIEAGILTDKDKTFVVSCIIDSTNNFRRTENNPCIPVMVKTSTGMVYDGDNCKGATVQDIKLIYNLVNQHNIGIKAAGGIRDAQTAKEMIEAGADRIGASKSVEMITNG